MSSTKGGIRGLEKADICLQLVSQMLIIIDKRGRGVRQMMTITDKGRGILFAESSPLLVPLRD